MALIACGEDPPRPAPGATASDEASADEAPTRAAIAAATDRRESGGALERGRVAPDPSLRRAAVLGLARLHDPDVLPALRAGLRDPDPEVRGAASLGIGALTRDRAGLSRVLAGALAVEPDPGVRAAMLRDLGRLHTRVGARVAASALGDASPVLRAGACVALAEVGLAGGRVALPVQARVAGLLDAGQPVEVRRAAAYALGRLPPLTDAQGSQGIVVALGLAAADPAAEVRAFAHRALARIEGADPAVAAHGVMDPEWRVAAQASSALGRIAGRHESGPRLLAEALNGLAEEVELQSPRLHVLMALLRAAGPHARSGPVYEVATRVHASLADGEPTRERGLAHCAAAELVDRGRGWPSRLERCGLGQVARWEQQVQEANVLGDLDGAPEQRLVRLRRLFEAERPAVRQATLGAAAKIAHPEATGLVIEGLEVADPGVRASALGAIATVARRVPSEDFAPPPLPAARAIAGLEAAIEAAGPAELETRVTWLDAVEAVDARRLAPRVRRLAAHPSHGVRSPARALLEAWELEPPARVEETAHAVSEFVDLRSRPRVRLRTRHGAIELELRPDLAPATVTRFLELVDAGFYEGLTFHRVVPGFVAQGGDPRGDGYGGPAFWQRCEDHRLPYRRGTVGMALAGRDTGGSQFFIVHGPQPHLELRYTAFAEVVDGMDVVDRLVVGDTIQSAQTIE